MAKHINEFNPLGIIEIDHLEFTCDKINSKTKDLFYTLGFERTYENTGYQSELFTQGQVRFLLNANEDEHSHSRKYFNNHGEGVSKISFLVEDCDHALKTALHRGAEVVHEVQKVESEYGVYKIAQIKGFGEVLNELVERPRTYFRPEYFKVENDKNVRPLINNFTRIDHLTNNVPKGEMDKWVQFYKDIYGFVETRYFDIKGLKTGLLSKVVQLKNNSVIIPINEPDTNDSQSQIQEFLDLHNGPGVQHIALFCPDIISTIGDLIDRGLKFLDIPHTYYEDVPKRNLKVTEDLAVLEKLKILVDGDPEGYLLQIFSKTYIGPSFFEFIQRKKHMGFGEGNFQALFDSIERDQRQRGYLK